MSTLFLYGLGLCCLSVIGLLILDAHIAKRRLRDWASNRNPFGEDPALACSQASGENGLLLKRRKIFKPAFLITTAITILLVGAIKRHATSTNQHQAPATTANMHAQDNNAENMTFSMVLLQTTAFGCDPQQLNTLDCMLGVEQVEQPSNSESDLNSSAVLSLNFDVPSNNHKYDAQGLSFQGGKDDYVLNSLSTQMNTDNCQSELNYSLNGTLVAGLDRTKTFNASRLLQ